MAVVVVSQSIGGVAFLVYSCSPFCTLVLSLLLLLFFVGGGSGSAVVAVVAATVVILLFCHPRNASYAN